MFQRRTLLHIPQSIRTDCILQKQLMITIDHSFRPNGETKLELYTLSADEICVVKNLRLSENWSLCGSSQWYPSLILEINWDQRDLLVKYMHNSGYDKNCFFWSPRDDIY